MAVFGEQVVIGLFLGGTDFLGDRLIPFVAVRKDGVDVEHDAAKIEHAVAHDVARRKASEADQGGSNGCGKFGGGIECQMINLWLFTRVDRKSVVSDRVCQ